MTIFSAPYQASYWWSRFLLQRAIGVIYLIAFISALNQFIPLLGENGLLPLPQFLQRMDFKTKPSIFHWRYSDDLFRGIAISGIVLSVIAASSLAARGPFWVPMLIWFLLWALYMSIVNVGIVFYSFGWESMLLEVGFYMIFLGPLRWAAPVLVIWMIRWMLFRVEFGAGLIKIRGDQCWRDLTCMDYHHETQPQPNPLSWFAHHLPTAFHKMETLGNHSVQLVIVWGLFFPQPIAAISAGFIIISQLYLVLTGNYSWLNLLTIFLAFSGLDDHIFYTILGITPPVITTLPFGYFIFIILLAFFILYLSIKPVMNMLSPSQRMNFSFNPVHLVNTYGAFGSVTKQRYEIIIEGTLDKIIDENTHWEEYEFKGKPGNPNRISPQIAPYHLRLDWQMWFAAMSANPAAHPWFRPLIAKLLQNDEATLKLMANVPFPDAPPTYIRARLFHYRFTTHSERKQTGQWWKRDYVSQYLPPVSLAPE
jgi:hypothetical protein